ncbi:MAG: hypothetical protein H0V30_00800 [Chitinophagaceae bacterium]|jgi:hypothetical protein|nr:hypothetical protein [Chitinophagaceae bacterium]
MKFLVSVVLIVLLAFLIQLFLPWWSLAIVAFLVGILIYQRAGMAFLSGFTALFLLWGGIAFFINIQNQDILARKVALLLPLGGSSILLILVTALVGALVAGMASLSGHYLRKSRKLS